MGEQHTHCKPLGSDSYFLPVELHKRFLNSFQDKIGSKTVNKSSLSSTNLFVRGLETLLQLREEKL